MQLITLKRLLAALALALAASPGVTNAADGAIHFSGAITESTCIVETGREAHTSEACNHCDPVKDHVSITTEEVGEDKRLVTLSYS